MEIHFNVRRISKIKLIDERVSDEFVYQPSIPIKRFFWFLKPNKYTNAGFIDVSDTSDVSSWSDCIYTEEELIRYGYKVYSEQEQIANGWKGRVFNKAFVEVTLDSKDSIRKSFENYLEAKEYVEYLKDISGIDYSILTF